MTGRISCQRCASHDVLLSRTLRPRWASFAQSRLNTTTSTSAASPQPTRPPPQRRWPGLALSFVGGFGLITLYNLSSSSNLSSNDSLNPKTFTPFTLVAKTPVSSTSTVFTLRPTPSTSPSYSTLWNTPYVWSVQIKQPQLQIARAYTPLPPSPSTKPSSASSHAHDIDLLVRHYPTGELSNYLHAQPLTAPLALRGPHVELTLPPHIDEVVFLAGGTGIAPALQVACGLLQRSRDSTSLGEGQGETNIVLPRMRILWANRRREDCLGGPTRSDVSKVRSTWLPAWLGGAKPNPTQEGDSTQRGAIVQRLADLEESFDGALSVDYFVDEDRRFIGAREVRRCLESPSPQRETTARSPGRKLLLVSGPEGFLAYIAGAKRWEDGREVQGPLGGLLGGMDTRGWDVWKL